MNIVDPIFFQAALQPMNAAICSPSSANRLISYGRLTQVINNVSRALRRLGVNRGKIVAISVKDEIFAIAIALALSRLGASSIGKYRGVPSTFRIDAVIADRYPEQVGVGQSVILADTSWFEMESDPLPPDELPADCANELCRIVFTSGSTGTAKAVGLTHRMLADRVPRHMTICGARFPRYSRIYCDLSVSTSLGFQFLIYTLWRGGMFLVPGENFAQTAAAIEEYKAECWIASPGGLELLVKWFERTPSLASQIQFAISGGDKTSRSLADRVRARVCSHVLATYGSSEAGMTATSPLELLVGDPDAVGVVAPDMVMQSVDEDDRILPAGQVGHIRVRGPVTVHQYLEDEAASAKSFRNGWFYPGDLGAITATNMLRIIGRQDNLLNLGGDKVAPETIENVLARCPGLTECAVFGVREPSKDEEIWIALPAEIAVADADLKEFCEKELPRPYWPSGYIRVAKIPRNDMGKIDRRALLPLWTTIQRAPGGSQP